MSGANGKIQFGPAFHCAHPAVVGHGVDHVVLGATLRNNE